MDESGSNRESEPLIASGKTRAPDGAAFDYSPFRNVLLVAIIQSLFSYCFYSLFAVLAIFLNEQAHMSQSAASFVVNLFVFLTNSFAVYGGILADSVHGRFDTVCIGCFASSLGFCALVGSLQLVANVPAPPSTAAALTAGHSSPAHAHIPPMPSSLSPHTEHINFWFLGMGLFLVSLGNGMTVASMSSFVGDQLSPLISQQEQHAEDVLLDDAANHEEAVAAAEREHERGLQVMKMVSRYYRLYYISFNVGAIGGMLGTTSLVQASSYSTAFIVMAVASCLAYPLLLYGKRDFILLPPTALDWEPLRDRTSPDYRALLRLITVFSPLPIFWALFYNIPSLWTFSAEAMNRHVGKGWQLPAGSLGSLNPLFDIFLIPVFEFIIDPLVRGCGVDFHPLRRMTVGMLSTSGSLVMAGAIQFSVQEHPNSVSVLWQIPQYVLLSAGEILLSVTGLEFAYTQAPPNYRGLVMGLFFFTQAAGNLLVAAVAVTHVGSLAEDYFFFATLMFVFVFFFTWLTRYSSFRLDLHGADDMGGALDQRHPSDDTYVPGRRKPSVHEQLYGVDVDDDVDDGFSGVSRVLCDAQDDDDDVVEFDPERAARRRR